MVALHTDAGFSVESSTSGFHRANVVKPLTTTYKPVLSVVGPLRNGWRKGLINTSRDNFVVSVLKSKWAGAVSCAADTLDGVIVL